MSCILLLRVSKAYGQADMRESIHIQTVDSHLHSILNWSVFQSSTSSKSLLHFLYSTFFTQMLSLPPATQIYNWFHPVYLLHTLFASFVVVVVVCVLLLILSPLCCVPFSWLLYKHTYISPGFLPLPPSLSQHGRAEFSWEGINVSPVLISSSSSSVPPRILALSVCR